jgi:ribosome-associated protein
MEMIQIHTETIQLSQLLKLAGAAATGGEVKAMLETSSLLVNGKVETARRRQLRAGDVVTLIGENDRQTWQVCQEE